jgi:hypothetical protein
MPVDFYRNCDVCTNVPVMHPIKIFFPLDASIRGNKFAVAPCTMKKLSLRV